jgi:hypothetical protein
MLIQLYNLIKEEIKDDYMMLKRVINYHHKQKSKEIKLLR